LLEKAMKIKIAKRNKVMKKHIEGQRIDVVGEGLLTHLLVCFDIVELLEQ